MGNFILEYQAPIDSITDKRKLGLTAYALNDHEWELLHQLWDVLKVHALFDGDVTLRDTLQILKDATLFYSHTMPNLVMVLPTIDYIDETFTNNMLQKQTVDPAIRAAIKLAKKTLNRYYRLTDLSVLYRIAMGLFHL